MSSSLAPYWLFSAHIGSLMALYWLYSSFISPLLALLMAPSLFEFGSHFTALPTL